MKKRLFVLFAVLLLFVAVWAQGDDKHTYIYVYDMPIERGAAVMIVYRADGSRLSAEEDLHVINPNMRAFVFPLLNTPEAYAVCLHIYTDIYANTFMCYQGQLPLWTPIAYMYFDAMEYQGTFNSR